MYALLSGLVFVFINIGQEMSASMNLLFSGMQLPLMLIAPLLTMRLFAGRKADAHRPIAAHLPCSAGADCAGQGACVAGAADDCHAAGADLPAADRPVCANRVVRNRGGVPRLLSLRRGDGVRRRAALVALHESDYRRHPDAGRERADVPVGALHCPAGGHQVRTSTRSA